jgi:hypothetical protein
MQCRFAVALQNLAGVTVNTRCFGGNLLILIQQLAERFAIWFPAAHPLRRQFDDENRGGKTGRFGVKEKPMGIVHFLTALKCWSGR